MQFRGLLIAVAVLAVLGGGVWWSQRAETNKPAAAASDAPKLITLKDDDIRQIEIRRLGSPPTVLSRDGSGKWQITAPEPLRADAEAASGVVSSFTNLSWDRLVDEKPSDLSAYGLQSPAVDLVVTGKDNKKHRLEIGDETPTGGSFYAKLEGDPRVFAIFSAAKTGLDKTAKDLRDKRLLTFDSEKLTKLQVNTKGQTVEFAKNSSNEWQVVKPKPYRADGGQVDQLIRKLKDAKMDTSVSGEDASKAVSAFGKGTPIGAAAVTDNSGTQTLQVRKSGNDYYARSSVLEGTYKVPNELGESLNKTIDDFRNKKLFDFSFSEPNKVEVRDGTKTYSFSKSGDKWTSGNKTVDSTSVQNLIDKLRDLSAIKFLDSGASSPGITLTVVSNDGKRVETVTISKTGDRYLAQRANEPDTYELDSKAVEEIQRAAPDVKEPPAPAPKK